MSGQQLTQLKELFALALASPHRRDELLSSCRDQTVRERAEALLTLHGSADGFMSKPLPEEFGVVRRHQLVPGDLVGGKYLIEKLLSQSGFASVYLATNQAVGERHVVVKVLDRVHRKGPVQKALTAEIRALSVLHHPNIVSIMEKGELEDGTPFLVLAYVAGMTLRDVMTVGSLSPSRVRSIVAGIARPLSVAHSQGITHLDVKPENVMLTESGAPAEAITLIDFGIAAIKGTLGPDAASPQYQAPDRVPSPASDTYSLARIAFELFTGRLPENGGRVRLWWRAGFRAARAIHKALQVDPARRQASIIQLARAVEAPRFELLAIVAVLVSAVSLVALRGRPVVLPIATPVPFVTDPGFDSEPAFSPDGKWIFYVAGTVGKHEIRRKLAAGGEGERVTSGAFDDSRPEVSPDGKQLAFSRAFGNAGTAIMLRSVEGQAAEEAVATLPQPFDSMTWTPDSRSILVGVDFTDGTHSELRRFELSSRTWTRFTAANGFDSAYMRRPTFSPDGRKLVMVRVPPQGGSELIVAELGAGYQIMGEPRVCHRSAAFIEQTSWTPDGREILFVIGPLSNAAAWRIPASGGTAVQLLAAAGRIERIAVPQHAWKLAYSLDFSDSNVWRLNLATRQQTQVIEGTYDDEQAHLSPDGKWIAFGSGRSGEAQIWLSRADGTEQRQLSRFQAVDAIELVWTPDSSRLILSIRKKERGTKILVTPIDHFEPREIFGDGMATALSRDGRWIYFRSRRSGQWQIWRLEFANPNNIEQLTEGGAYHAVESKDGRSLYFTKRDESEGIWRIDLPHGQPERVLPGVYRRSLFAPASAGLFFAERAPKGLGQVLFFRDGMSGKTTELYHFPQELFWGFDLSPDEKSILFSQFDVGNSDIMLINDFR